MSRWDEVPHQFPFVRSHEHVTAREGGQALRRQRGHHAGHTALASASSSPFLIPVPLSIVHAYAPLLLSYGRMSGTSPATSTPSIEASARTWGSDTIPR